MKIQYLAFIRLPTEKAHGAQIMKTCEAFSAAGADVSLVVPGRRTHIEGDAFSHYGITRTFPLTSLATPDFVSFGPLGFLFSMLWFAESAKLRREFWSADGIYSRDAGVLLQYILLGRKLIYEAHTRPTPVSRFVARRAWRVIVISEALAQAYVRAGVPRERIAVAPDAIDMRMFEAQIGQKEAREKLGLPQEKKLALYVGRIDTGKGAEIFARAFSSADAPVAGIIIGSGPLRERISREYPQVRLVPETPYRDLANVLSAGDVLVIPNSGTDPDASRYTSPLKAFAYLASGIPIVASDVPALHEALGDCASFFTPDNPDALLRAAVAILEDPDAETRAARGKERARNFSWERRAATILAHAALV